MELVEEKYARLEFKAEEKDFVLSNSMRDLTLEEKTMIDNEPEVFMRNVSEAINKQSPHPMRAYCTTSSVYAEHTISNPNNDQVNYW